MHKKKAHSTMKKKEHKEDMAMEHMHSSKKMHHKEEKHHKHKKK